MHLLRASGMKKIIYDVGANNGGDIPYYLMKADLVVAIEANPALCDGIRKRFAEEIEQGRLLVESCVVTAEERSGEVDFYVHNTHHVLSQLDKPGEDSFDLYTPIKLPSQSILKILQTHGAPHYVKIDIEHYDTQLLKALFAGGVHPPYISAEAHSIDVFCTLVGEGGYRAFKLVDGYYVARDYKDFTTQCGLKYAFPMDSAGPFGNDVQGEWMTSDHFFQLLAYWGLGWIDIHATNVEQPNPNAKPSTRICLERLHRDEMVNSLQEMISGAELLSLIKGRAKRWMRHGNAQQP
ncbi:MAG: FkbM family methyltransferase [Cyanobacteriota bacterium]|nr:FkbM family methyltransferase [Cyanobacteriota bacterium]